MPASGIALVTGASSGIGAVYARRLAARGYSLILVARRGDRLTGLATDLGNEFGVAVHTLSVDLTTEAGIGQIVRLLGDERVDLLVNNAGMGPIASTAELPDDAALATLTLNVEALMRLTRAALPGMQSRRSGTIINVGSVMAYSATKAFVLTYSQGIAQEVRDQGVHVQAVLPAGTITDFYDAAGVPLSNFDQSAFMTAEQLVDAALEGLDRGEEVTLPSVHDAELWQAFEAARANLFGGTQNGSPAPRYLAG